MATDKGNPADSNMVIAAALAAAAIGALFYNVLPLYVGTAADSKTLDSQQQGLLATAFFCGFNLAGITSFLWVRRINWRLTCYFLAPTSAAVLWFGTTVSEYGPLIAVTAFAGLLFGALLCIGSTILGDTSDPTRWYGVKNVAESSGGVVLMLVLPTTLIPKYGFEGTIGGMALWMLLLAPLMFFLPGNWSKASSTSSIVNGSAGAQTAASMNVAAFTCALVSFFLFFAGNSAVWAFGERMGNDAGFSQESTGTLLAFSLVSGIVASSVVAVAGKRFSNLKYFVVSAFFGLASLAFLSAKGSFTAYGVGFCLYMAGWSAGYSVAMAEISELDVNGRYVALSIGAMGFGAMLGPAVAGWLYEVAGHFEVMAFTSSFIVLSVVLMVIAVKQGRSPLKSLH